METRNASSPSCRFRWTGRNRGTGRNRWTAAVRTLAASVLGVSALVPVQAWAQSAELALPTIARDRGVRSGDFTLHPSIALMGHHDTNLFNGSDEEPGNKPRGATSLRFLPKLSLANDADSNTTFRFDAGGDARIYLSDVPAIEAQQGVGGFANLDLTFGARKAIGFTLFDRFSRTLRSNNWETTQTLNRNANDVGARIEFHPGDVPERRPFNVSLAGSYSMDRFEDFEEGDTNTIRTRLSASWRFLPKTAAVIDSTWDFRSFDDPKATLQKKGLVADSQPFRVRAGLSGALTKRLTMNVLGGWGLSEHETGDSFNSYLATVQMGIRASESTRLLLGYERDFRDSYYGNFVAYHKGSLALRQRFGNILDVQGGVGVSYLLYGSFNPFESEFGKQFVGSVLGQIAGKNRHDLAVDGGLKATFEVARLVGMDIGYNLRLLSTPYTIKGKDAAATVLEVGSYTAHEIFASVSLRY